MEGIQVVQKNDADFRASNIPGRRSGLTRGFAGWFNNQLIRIKLLYAFGGILALIVVVSCLSVWTTRNITGTVNQVFNHDGKIADIAQQIQAHAMKMQDTEKAYILYFKVLGFDLARESLVGRVEKESLQIKNQLDELGKLLTDKDSLDLNSQIDQFNSEFRQSFVATVQLIEKRGFKDFGLEGALRAKVHDIEQAIEKLHSDHLAVDMLMIRRHEKDYLLLGEGKSMTDAANATTKVANAIATLKADVASAAIAADNKKELALLADDYLNIFNDLSAVDARIAENSSSYRNAVNSMNTPLEAMSTLATQGRNTALSDLVKVASESQLSIGLTGLVAVVLGILLAFTLSRMIERPVIAITAMVRKMAAGSLDESLAVNSKDEIGQLSHSMLEMQSRLKKIIELEIFGIIRDAGDGNLANRIEVNDKSGFYCRLAQSINELINVNEMFLNDTAIVVSDLAEGRLEARQAREYRGLFAKVQDDVCRMRNNLVQVINKDIGAIVEYANKGDLDHKVNLDGKQGFYLELSRGINSLVETNASIINDSIRVIGSLSKGSLGEKYNRQYPGNFGQLQQYVQQLQENLQRVIENEIQTIVQNAVKGSLKDRIALDRKEGFYRALSDSINQLVDTSDRIISDASRVVGAVARGDLTQTITNDYLGTFGQLKSDINKTVSELIVTVEGIQKAALSVDSGSSEIASGNSNLSQRTEEQAASLEETSAAMEEMTATVKQTAENSAMANQLSKESIDTAVKGGEIVNNSIRSMDLIQASSNQMAEIVSVIDEIAFQTNLLALNASVEAARAGEKGRGFAVVADEVRVLAGRSAKAAKEIKELIRKSCDNVKSGSELANKSGFALQEIIIAARKVNTIVGEITTACDEQALGISEIQMSLMQMDTVTQQNAALVEEAAAASESLSEQSRDLSKLVSIFRLGKDLQAGNKLKVIRSAPRSLTA